MRAIHLDYSVFFSRPRGKVHTSFGKPAQYYINSNTNAQKSVKHVLLDMPEVIPEERATGTVLGSYPFFSDHCSVNFSFFKILRL